MMDKYEGLAASPGIAIGPAFVYLPEPPAVRQARSATDAERERQHLDRALTEAQQQLAQIYKQSVAEVGEDTASIFLAHQEFLQDPAVLDEVRARMDSGLSAAAAVEDGFEMYAQQLEALEDSYYRERALDLRDVSRRLRRILSGTQDDGLSDLQAAVIVVAHDLTPSDTAQMDKTKVLGFCTATGGLTSHTAIIARILGIPAAVGLGDTILQVAPGTPLIVDGHAGTVLAAPDEETTRGYVQRRDAQAAKQELDKAAAQRPGSTQDGHHVEVVANIADAASARTALEFGAEGVGLFRTEYLFLNRQSVPTEEQQYENYRAVADVLGSRPLIIRTLDIGGDKQLPYLDIGAELNPFLGWRAIRLCLDTPQIFEPQLRAILRASVNRNVQIMFPMIATLDEVRRARQVLERVKEQLVHQGTLFDPQTQIGIMVEVPAAALMADVLAQHVDFFSIGSNDLIQYTMACDRGNEKVSYLYDPLYPAVLRLIQRVIDAAHQHGKWVGMCGEMAGEPEAIPLLLGMGLDEFSMNAASIPAAKALIATLTLKDAQEFARVALTKSTAQEVREYLRNLGLARASV
jgi:phosphotransferase system enzyme I (PtsI)